MTGHVKADENARTARTLMGAETSTTELVFRQRSPLGTAAVGVVTGLLLLVSLARSWADNPQPLFASWVLFELALMWSLFIRPAVVLDDHGVTLRNVVRDVFIPWVQVTDAEYRWNLKVFAGDLGYTAWAISSQVERPKRVTGGMFGNFMSPRLDKYAIADTHLSATAQKVTASMVARSIAQAKQQYEEAVAQGALSAAPEVQVRITWVPLVLAILLLPAIAVAVLSLT
jgi:Bacterial PH domain